MRKKHHFLELALITAAIALSAGWMLHRPTTPTPTGETVTTSPTMADSFKSGEYQRCLDASLEQLGKDPTDLMAIRFRGMALAGLGRTQEAMTVYDHGVDIAHGPMDWLLYSNGLSKLLLERGRLHVRLAQPQQAVKDLEKGIELTHYGGDFPSWQFKDLLGRAQFSLGREAEARQAFRDAASNGSKLSDWHLAKLTDGNAPFVACDDWCPVCHQPTGVGHPAQK